MALVNAAGPSAPVLPLVVAGAGTGSGKDSRWLTLEVCREFARSKCSRSDEECKYAHPPPHVDVQNGRVMCCFDSIKGKCQRKEPPCKYLHPPQHLKEILLQNGRQNLIYKNLALQAASLQSLGCIPQTVIPLMYENGATLKQPTGAILHPGAGASSGLIFHTATSAAAAAAAAGQFVTMLPGGGASSGQYLLPTAATPAAAGIHAQAATACYNPAAAATGFLAAGLTEVSAPASSNIASHANNSAAWSVPGFGAGCYGLPTGAHAVTYDANYYQASSCSSSSSSYSSPDEASSGAVNSMSVTSASDSVNVTSSAYCQPLYYKPQYVELYATGTEAPAAVPTAAVCTRKRPAAIEPAAAATAIDADGLFLGVSAVAGGVMPVLKRPALIDAKTGLPVYRQLTATSYPPHVAAINAVQAIQPQPPFISFPLAGRTQILPRM